MKFRRFLFRRILLIVGLLILTACDLAEQPVEFAEFKLEETSQTLPQAKSLAICRAIEDAGFMIPYDPTISWFHFDLTQIRVVLSRSGNTLVSIPSGNPQRFVLVDPDASCRDHRWGYGASY